jgi:hypothetical protein
LRQLCLLWPRVLIFGLNKMNVMKDSITGVWNSRWTKWHWEWSFSESFGFPSVSIIPPLLNAHLHLHVAFARRTNGRNLGTFQTAALIRKSRRIE